VRVAVDRRGLPFQWNEIVLIQPVEDVGDFGFRSNGLRDT
jgi:hypothetical protein